MVSLMPSNNVKLTKRAVEAATVRERAYTLWDCDVAGFGLRVQPTGVKSYIAFYRIGVGRGAKQRQVTIGKSTAITCEAARREAQKYIGLARAGEDRYDAIRRAENENMSVARVIDLWAEEAASINRRTGKPRQKAGVLNDINRLNAHVKPLIGLRPIGALSKGDVEKLRDDITKGKTACVVKTRKYGLRQVKGGEGTAKRTISTFKSVLSFAVDRGFIVENVALGVRLAPDNKCERFLSEEEAGRVGAVLAKWEAQERRMNGVRIVKLLLLTGARTAEIEELRWSEIDFDQSFFRFRNTKSGKSIRPVCPQALEILRATPKRHDELVFPNKKLTGPYRGTQSAWRDIRVAAGVPDVRKHDLRHSFASFGISSGLSLPIIGALLGHLRPETTQRYAHLADSQARQAAVSVGGVVESALKPQ